MQIQGCIERITSDKKLQRIAELFQPTTQFSTTGRKFAVEGSQLLIAAPVACLFAIEACDEEGRWRLDLSAALAADRAVT